MRNTNFNVTTNRSTITAEDTSNFSNFGEGARIHLKNVQNHELQQVHWPVPHKIEWKHHILKDNVGVRVHIDFSEYASIDAEKYQLNTFNFSIQPTSPTTLEVLEEHGTLSLDSVGSSQVTLSIFKDADKQTLTMMTPLTKQDEGRKPTKFTINVQPSPFG